VEATILVPGAAVWCCGSVDFATFVLAGSALAVAMPAKGEMLNQRSSGLRLSEEFYRACVAPAMAAEFPRLPHAAGLMGRGSEVLGYDDSMSTDHTWSARVIVFVPDEVLLEQGESLQSQVTARIPDHFDGLATEVKVTTVYHYFLAELGLDVAVGWDAYDWVSLPEQRLCAMTAGAVFHDDLDLEKVRRRLAYYPRDAWLYLMLAGWWRVHPEMNLVGRAGYAGDELGSALIASTMVSGLMHLSFLIERQYAPYRKWFGTAFSKLQIADRLSAPLDSALHARSWRERENALGSGYEIVAAAFNDLEIAPRLTLEPVRLWGRPFTVMWADFPGALSAAISDPQVRDLVERWPTGGIDQVRDILWAPQSRIKVRELAKQ
jgi:hypothetical protein